MDSNLQLERINEEISQIDCIIEELQSELKSMPKSDKKTLQTQWSLIARFKSEKSKLMGLYNAVEQDLAVKRFLLELQIDKLTAEIAAMNPDESKFTDMEMLAAHIKAVGKKINRDMESVLSEEGKKTME